MDLAAIVLLAALAQTIHAGFDILPSVNDVKEGDSYHRGYAAISEGSCFIGGLTSATPPQASSRAEPSNTASPAARIFREAT